MFNDSPVLASLRKALLFVPVEFVDVTALVEFLDEAGIDEIRRLGGSGPLVIEPELVEDGFDPLGARVLFCGQLFFVDVAFVGSLYKFLILQAKIFRRDLQRQRAVAL
jgi:hypothetical protein